MRRGVTSGPAANLALRRPRMNIARKLYFVFLGTVIVTLALG